jgi:hypothetical protein
MKKQKYNRQVVIEEVARIALESKEIRSHVGHELNLTNKEMNDAYRHLCRLLKSK